MLVDSRGNREIPRTVSRSVLFPASSRRETYTRHHEHRFARCLRADPQHPRSEGLCKPNWLPMGRRPTNPRGHGTPSRHGSCADRERMRQRNVRLESRRTHLPTHQSLFGQSRNHLYVLERHPQGQGHKLLGVGAERPCASQLLNQHTQLHRRVLCPETL